MSKLVFIMNTTEFASVDGDSLSHIKYESTDRVGLYFDISQAGAKTTLKVVLTMKSGRSREGVSALTALIAGKGILLFNNSSLLTGEYSSDGVERTQGKSYPTDFVQLVHSITYTEGTIAQGPTGPQGPAGADAQDDKVFLDIRVDEAVSKGDPLYITGYNSGQNRITVAKADAADSAKMPSIGLASAAYSTHDNGRAITMGSFEDVDTSSFSEGDVLYVAATGGLTATKPTGTNLIQNVGKVGRSNQNNGEIVVMAIGRSNDVPNIPNGQAWIGNASGVATPTTLADVATSGSYTDLSDKPTIPTGDVVDDTTPQLGGDLDTNSNNITFADSDEAQFGNDSDLRIYHAGSSINHIYGLSGSSTYLTGGTDLYLRGVNGEEGVIVNGNGSVELFYDNFKKLETKATGVDITGNLGVTGTVDGVDIAGRDHDAVTLANTNYLSLSGQEITGGTVPVGSGGTGVSTHTTNALLIGAGSGNIGSYSTLTYDQSKLLLSDGDYQQPTLEVRATHVSGTPGQISLSQLRTTGTDNQTLGTINFIGNDDSGQQHTFGTIRGKISDASNGAEGGKLEFIVASHNGTITQGLALEDGSTTGEVDVTVGAGSFSVTEVVGNLEVGNAIQGDVLIRGTRVRFNTQSSAPNAAGEAEGDILMYGSTATTAGKVYMWGGTNWGEVDATNEAKTNGLLGVALGSNSNLGMLVRGVAYLSHDPGNSGDILYVSDTNTGQLTSTAPADDGEFVRVAGYCLADNLVYFDPSKDYIEVA